MKKSTNKLEMTDLLPQNQQRSNLSFVIDNANDNLEAETAIINNTTLTTTTTLNSSTEQKAASRRRRQNCPNPCIKTSNENNANDSEQEEIVFKYGAQHVIMLFIPVSACMLFVIISLNVLTSYQQSNGQYLVYTPFHENTNENTTKIWQSIANAAILIGVVVVMTIFLIILYKYKCYKLIHGWLMLSSFMLLFFFTYTYVVEVFKMSNLVIDFVTLIILIWNFGCIGMIVIHWVGPLRLQQVYLIFVSSQMALIFVRYLPEWTAWVVLAFISAWDLIAVLTPCGPLRILVETAKSRNDKLFPALIYSSTIMYPLAMMTNKTNSSSKNLTKNKNNDNDEDNDDNGSTIFDSPRTSNRNHGGDDNDDSGFTNNDVNRRKRILKRNQQVEEADDIAVRVVQPSQRQQQQQEMNSDEEEEDNGVKLGLGDFIFYSVLVGKASILGDWNTVIACFVAILIGLCFTLVLLAIFHKALPALPISLTFGLIFYFCTNLVVRPFYDDLTRKQLFI